MKTTRHFLQYIVLSIMVIAMSVPAAGQTKRVRPPARHFIITCGTLINPATNEVTTDAYVEIISGKIIGVGKTDDLKADPAVRIVDYGGKYVIPGLIDTHGHTFGGVTYRYTTCEYHPAFYLAAGVTTVRSPGSMEPEGDFALRNRIDSGRLAGPRYFHSGEYVEQDPVTVRWMQPVTTQEEARLKIDQMILKGATSIKLYAAIGEDIMRDAVAYGHAYGVKVISHIGEVTYKQAIEAGIDELFHGIIAMPDVVPETVDTRNTVQYYTHLANLDMGQPVFREIAELAAKYSVVITPTLDVMAPVETDSEFMAAQKRYYTPEAWAKLQERSAKPLLPHGAEILEKNIEFVRIAHEAGCILTTGTDIVGFSCLPGFSLRREMELFAEAGIEPVEILKAATSDAAYALGRSDQLGSIEPGMLADCVILNENPLESISNVAAVHAVIKGGVIYDPEDLLKPLQGVVR